MRTACDAEYYLLLKGMCDISEGVLPDQSHYVLDAEGLFLKAFYHAASFAHLAVGTDIPSLKKNFIDPATPQIIGRAALETALTFYYVYCYPSSPEQRELYYDFWVYKGLKARHRYEPKYIELLATWQEEKLEISKLEERIKNNTLFMAIDNELRKKCLKSKEWRVPIGRKINSGFKIHSWTEIAELADMSKTHME